MLPDPILYKSQPLPSTHDVLNDTLQTLFDAVIGEIAGVVGASQTVQFTAKSIGVNTLANYLVTFEHRDDGLYVNGARFALTVAGSNLGSAALQVLSATLISALGLTVGEGPLAVLAVAGGLAVGGQWLWSKVNSLLPQGDLIDALFGTADTDFRYMVDGQIVAGAMFPYVEEIDFPTALGTIAGYAKAGPGGSINVYKNGNLDTTYSILTGDATAALAAAMGVGTGEFDTWNWAKDVHGTATTNGTQLTNYDGIEKLTFVASKASVALKIWAADGLTLENVPVQYDHIGFGQDLPLATDNGLTVIVGGDLDDTLKGPASTGPVYIIGGAGGDIIDGGSGDDRLIGGSIENAGKSSEINVLSGHGGNDLIVGAGGADIIDGGAGSDVLLGGYGNDRILGGDDNDTIYGDRSSSTGPNLDGDDQLVGGTGIDKIFGDDGADILIGGEGTNLSSVDLTTYHHEWNDGVADLLNGGFGNDTYYISQEIDYNNNTLAESLLVVDMIDEGTTGDGVGDIRVQNHEIIDLVGGATEEITKAIQVKGSYVVNYSNDDGTHYSNVSWTPQNSTTQWIAQVLVSNILDESGQPYVFLMPEYPDGGQPYAVIKGFRQGDFGIYLDGYIGPQEGTSGNDIIQGPANDRLQRTLVAAQNSITLGSNPDSDQRIDGGAGDDIVYGWGGQDELRGSEGNDQLFGGAGADRLSGGNGDDLLDGGDDADTLLGNAGNDTLRGGAGSDTYIYASGDGSDVIDGEGDFAGDTDILSFQDIKANDVTLSRNDDKLVLTLKATGDTITVNGEFTTGASASGIERIQFADGSSISRSDILASLGDGSNPGGPGDPGQTFTGTAGDDTLTGTSGSDTFDGGLGNDSLNGGDGSDTYLYRMGDGSDGILDESASTTDVDTLKFVDVNFADVTFSPSQNDLVATITPTGNTLSIYWQFLDAAAGWGLEKILFADGISMDLKHGATVWQINGTDGNDRITSPMWGSAEIFDGGKGNDFLDGTAGSDTYLYASGDGSDEINDDVGFLDDGNVDVLKLTDLNSSGIALSRDGNNLKVKINGTGDVITVDNQFLNPAAGFGIERIQFADGSSISRSDIESAISSSSQAMARTATIAITQPQPLDHVDLRPIVLESAANSAQATIDWSSSAWGGAGDGILAIDLGADGQSGADGAIDQAKEVSFSLWANASADGLAASNIDGLRQALDGNSDGVLDVNDARWSEFRLWNDANQNGITDPGELESLTDAGIKLINLMPAAADQSFADGSAVTGTATYGTLDSSSYLAIDTSQWAKSAGQQAA